MLPQRKRSLASNKTYLTENNECVATIAEKLGCDAHALLLLNRPTYRGLTLNAKLFAKTRLILPLDAAPAKVVKLSSSRSSKGKGKSDDALDAPISKRRGTVSRPAKSSVGSSPLVPSPPPRSLPYQISTPLGTGRLGGPPSSIGAASARSALDTPVYSDVAMSGSGESWRAGDRVEAYYSKGNSTGWYPAKIETLRGDGTYLLSWEDGDKKDRVKQALHIRALALAAQEADENQAAGESEMNEAGAQSKGGKDSPCSSKAASRFSPAKRAAGEVHTRSSPRHVSAAVCVCARARVRVRV